MKPLLTLLILFSTLLLAKENVTHTAQLNIKTHEMEQVCLKLTSDGQTLISRSDRQIDLWNSKDLKHLGSIKNVEPGWGCDLHKNNRYFLVQDMRKIYLYDIKTLKHIRDYDIPSIKYQDAIMSASFSNDGKYINSFQYKEISNRERKSILFQYNIDTQKRKALKSFPKLSSSYYLKKDKLYFYDSHQEKIFIYNISTGKQKEGTSKDKDIWSSVRSWWDCRDNVMPTKICTISNQIKYSLASGNLNRIDLKIKDPKFVPVLLKKLDFKDPFISNHALDTLLRFDVPVIEDVITELNKVDDCSQIMYLDLKNSQIAKKVSKEVFAKYRCENE